MVHRRELDGEILVFGNQGDLWGNAMTWWDHTTGSVWSQPLGEAILGAHTGATLEAYPATLTSWAAWIEAHPNSLALDAPSRSTRFSLDQMAIAVDFGTEAAAYLVSDLRVAGVVNDKVAGVPIAIVIDPDNDERWSVFSRQLDEEVIELELVDDVLVDAAGGTTFDPFIGLGLSGPLSDQQLDKLPGFTVFPADYFTFFPEGRTWPG
jgi:hypothetical protein